MPIINPTPAGPSKETIERAASIVRCLNQTPRLFDEGPCVRIEQVSPSGFLVIRVWPDATVSLYFTAAEGAPIQQTM